MMIRHLKARVIRDLVDTVVLRSCQTIIHEAVLIPVILILNASSSCTRIRARL